MFKIRSIDLDHEGGTKQYHLIEIIRSDGKASLGISRWGKTGAWGEMQFVDGKSHEVTSFIRDKLRAKQARKYKIVRDKSWDVKSEGDFKTVLGDYYYKLGSHLTGLLLGVHWDDTHPIDLDDEVISEPPAPESPKESASSKNPNWGMF